MKNSSCFRNVLSIICAVWVVCGKTGGIMHGKKKQYLRCLQQFRKNTGEQQWLVWLLLLQKTAVFSEIEQSDRIRSDMASGAVIVRSIDKFPHRDFSLNFIHDIERVFVGIGMFHRKDESVHLKRPCVRGHSCRKQYSHLHFHAESV